MDRYAALPARLLAPLALALAACAVGEPTSTDGQRAEVNDAPDLTFGGTLPSRAGVCTQAPYDVRDTQGDWGATCSSATYGGRARVVFADVDHLVKASLVDTGELATYGGTLDDALVTAHVPLLLDATVAAAEVRGANGRTTAVASIAQLEAYVAGLHLHADVIRADARAACSAGASGASVLTNLRINDASIVVDGSANQKLVLLGVVEVVVNEQVTVADGIRVAGIHVRAPGVDVVISSATATVTDCVCDTDDAGTPDAGTPDAGDDGSCGCQGDQGQSGDAPNGPIADHGGDQQPGTAGSSCDHAHPCASGFVCAH